MAQKRMFDKAIIETDNFLNVSLTAKALYFLFGMEADDEGFISPNRVLRLYGGEIGDVKNLIDVGLLIPFKSGVVVITHWNENNYLDTNRIKPTQYQKEKETLLLTDNKKYELNICSTRGEEKRGEERRREEKRIDLPEWLNKESWTNWEAYRKEIHKKLTPMTRKQQISFLEKNKEQHIKMLEQSIQNGWTGIFLLKGEQKKIESNNNLKDKYKKYANS